MNNHFGASGISSTVGSGKLRPVKSGRGGGMGVEEFKQEVEIASRAVVACFWNIRIYYRVLFCKDRPDPTARCRLVESFGKTRSFLRRSFDKRALTSSASVGTHVMLMSGFLTSKHLLSFNCRSPIL